MNIEILKEIKYNNEFYYLKLKNRDNMLYLEIKLKGKVLKTYKVIPGTSFYYKIQKTQIQTTNPFQLIAEINDVQTTNISNIFAKKLIEAV